MIGGLSLQGMVAMMTIQGGTSGDVFLSYIKNFLIPKMNPGDLVVMDNLGAHKDKRIIEAFQEAGIQIKYLPPYSPDKNPIEFAWSKIKSILRKIKARTREALDEALAWSMDQLTPSDLENWFKECGYQLS